MNRKYIKILLSTIFNGILVSRGGRFAALLMQLMNNIK